MIICLVRPGHMDQYRKVPRRKKPLPRVISVDGAVWEYRGFGFSSDVGSFESFRFVHDSDVLALATIPVAAKGGER